MIILPILTTSRTDFLLRWLGERTFWAWEGKGDTLASLMHLTFVNANAQLNRYLEETFVQIDFNI